MINRRALFTDETKDFKTPYEPKKGDSVTLTFRTLKNDVIAVYCFINGKKREMQKRQTINDFDYFEIVFTCPSGKVEYYFMLLDEDDIVYYMKGGVKENVEEYAYFYFKAGVSVPEWAKGAIYYQIYTDRFFNGNTQNDVLDNEYYYENSHVKHVSNWNAYPENNDTHNFYGGDLQGVEKKLGYLKDLGVEVIYFNPLFVSPSNHKYDTQDYDYIDPHLAMIDDDYPHQMEGWETFNSYAHRYVTRVTSKRNLQHSNEYFARLVRKIHDMGMRVVIDGVFNHCGSLNKWMDRDGIYERGIKGFKGAYSHADSPYRSYFNFYEDKPNSEYEGWWNYKTLPKLNFEGSPKLTSYVMDIAQKWVSAPYFVDGWRLDVAADLGHDETFNHKFWRRFRKRVAEANPNAVVFAEHYGDPSSWVSEGEWDTVMNYDAFMEPVTWFLTGMEKHSDSFDNTKFCNGTIFFESMFSAMSKLTQSAIDSALNQLSNHDHSRFLTRTNSTPGRINTLGAKRAGEGIKKDVMELAVLIQMTWQGSPGLYYGDEAGQVGWTDPDSRRTYPWGNEDKQLLDYHKRAIALRKSVKCLKLGSLKSLVAGKGYISYARFNREDCAVVIINRGEKPIELSIPVWEVDIPNGRVMECVLSTTDSEMQERVEVVFGRIKVTMPAVSGCVFKVQY